MVPTNPWLQSFFHTYLGRLGVKDVRVTDAFDIVDESLDPEYA